MSDKEKKVFRWTIAGAVVTIIIAAISIWLSIDTMRLNDDTQDKLEQIYYDDAL